MISGEIIIAMKLIERVVKVMKMIGDLFFNKKNNGVDVDDSCELELD